MGTIDIMKKSLQELDIFYNDDMLSKLYKFKDIMLEWNSKINLTTITEEEDVYIKHFIDSATCISTKLIGKNAKIIDVGTGAGFPGIPIKIFRSDIDMTLLDSLNKKIIYLKDVIDRLGLVGIDAIHSRAEEAGKNIKYRQSFDIALSRAVASLDVLCEYCLPFVKLGGIFICQKGPNYIEELEFSKKAINVLGGEIKDIIEHRLPNSDIIHYIIIIEKIADTPNKYPRKPGKPSANPIK